MNQKEYKSLIDDRDYWKKLCSELSKKDVEQQEKIFELKKEIKELKSKTPSGTKGD